MDTTTKNPRVIAIHFSRVLAHLAEAHRELNRVDASSLPPRMLERVTKATAKVWKDAIVLSTQPVKVPEKKAKAPKAPKNEVILLAPTTLLEAPAPEALAETPAEAASEGETVPDVCDFESDLA